VDGNLGRGGKTWAWKMENGKWAARRQQRRRRVGISLTIVSLIPVESPPVAFQAQLKTVALVRRKYQYFVQLFMS
jgi:hypothetical protein